MKNTLIGFLNGVILTLILSASAAAQNKTDYVTDSNSTGVAPFRTYAGARENIDLKNLNLNLVIPLATLPGRNGMDVELAVTYNSIIREWIEKQKQGGTFYIYDFIPEGGANDFPELKIAPTLNHLGAWYQLNGQSWHPNRYLVRRTDGTRHDLRDKDYDVDVNSTVYNTLERMRAADGTFMEYRESDNVRTGTLYLKNGTQIYFSSGAASWIRDTNGNKITFAGNVLTDTMGRTVTRTFDGTITNVSTLDAAGQNLIWILDNTLVSSTGNFPYTSYLTLATTNASNPQKFTFEWNQFGPLTSPDGIASGIMETKLVKVTYPMGGWTRYEWGLSSDLTKIELKRRCVSAGSGQGENCWTYQTSGLYVRNETRPDSSWIRHTFNGSGQETRTEHFSSAGTLMKTVDRVWTYQREVPLLTRETTTIPVSGGQPIVSKVEHDYDADGYVWNNTAWSNGNVTETREYDWGNNAVGPLLRTTRRTWWTGPNIGTTGLRILDRPLTETALDASGTQNAHTVYTYDSYQSPRTLISFTGAVQRDATFGTNYGTRGNLSKKSAWISGTDYADTWMRYDICGNVREVTDPNGRTTQTRYNLTYQFALPYEVEDAKGFKDAYQYDFSDATRRGFGLLTRITDPNSRQTNFTYDRWGRLKTTTYPDGGREDRYYSDTDLAATKSGVNVFKERTVYYPRVKTYTLVDTGVEKVATAVFDGLGRESMGGSSNGVTGKTDWTRTEYDGNGRVLRSSNPVTFSLENDNLDAPAGGFSGWTTNAYDGLDRIVETTTPDHTTANPQRIATEYKGAWTTVTDQASFKRKTRSDAAGRLVETVEPNESTNNLTTNSYSTTYQYTALDKLKQVDQGTQQRRTFVYDGLGRLTSETHPEWGSPSASSGTVTYQYDAASNLTGKTDARSVVSTFVYDQLNRMTSASFSDGTPTATYSYDSATPTNGLRRRTGMSDGAGGSYTYHYDTMGRISKIEWASAAFNQTGEFAWAVGGGLKSSNWPGRASTFNWTFDASGRQAGATWNDNGTVRTLVSGYSFDYRAVPAGEWALESTTLGNGTVEKVYYNNRLQPYRRQLENPSVIWALDYDFLDGANKNNGEIWGIDETTPGYTSYDVVYGYDWLHRIRTADSSGNWGLSFTIDRWGNRTAQSATSGTPKTNSLLISNTRNRITTSGYGYDDAGNLKDAPGAITYQYDANNLMKSVNSGAAGSYWYDGHGRRTKRTGSGETRWYFYDALGAPAWEYKTGVGWEAFNVYFNGRHMAVKNAADGLRWRTSDHLGSLRVKTDSTGAVRARYWYYPYGELWNSVGTDSDARKFTDKERDPESGWDYFGARYYASVQGRFTAVDPALESGLPGDPQTWNRYAYVGNRPTLMVDPDGRTGVKCDACGYSSANEAMAALPTRLAAETAEQKSLRSSLVGPAIVVATLVSPGPDELILGAALSRISAAAKLLSGAKNAKVLESVTESAVQANKARGDAFRDEIADLLRKEGRDVQTEVAKQTPFGKRVIDIEVSKEGKVLGGIETKTGKSRYTPSQRAKDEWLRQNGYPVDLVRDP